MSNREIMEQYNSGKLTRDEANASLDGVHLTERTPEELAAKKQREDEEGFFDPAELGLTSKPKITLARPDMRRNKDKAGTSEIQVTKQGRYEVFYNEEGYATKAVRK